MFTLDKISSDFKSFELNCCHAFKCVSNKESDYEKVDLPLDLNGFIEIQKTSKSFFIVRAKKKDEEVLEFIEFSYDYAGDHSGYFFDFIKSTVYEFLKGF